MADGVRVTRAEAPGMIALRGDHGDERLRAAAVALSGTAFPDRLRIEGGAARGLAWMAPDELLLLLPREEVAGALGRLASDLDGLHHLAADVSDMRALLRVDGPWAREVLAKLSPADLSPAAFGPGAMRRTRLGQVAAAAWLDGDGACVLCFRSVADYALALLAQSARDGAVGHF